jgi:hypothetical protein
VAVSVQGVVDDAKGLEQFPVIASHVPGWQLSIGGQVTALPAMHCPALLQVSFVQALLSKSHEVPFAFAEYVQFPDVGSHAPVPVWQVPAGGQVTALPAMHCPALSQVSFVQALLSKSHEVPFAFAEYVQFPDVGSHAPVPVWQVPAGGQVTSLPAMHCPALSQVSFVQALLSKSHEVPFAFAEYVQFPDVGSHVPVPVWQVPAGGQVTALPAMHCPALLQVSFVQALLSKSHEVPLAFAEYVQFPDVGSHVPVPVWQVPAGGQVTALPAMHCPALLQVSFVQALLSKSHEVPFAFAEYVQFPDVGSHVPVPVWQVPAGGQVTTLPAMHCPALLQVSFVQALLSKSHEVPLAFAEYVQFPDVGSHVPVPVWQVPAGGQVTTLPAMHCPALLQVSFVQALLSKSHEVPLAFAEYVQFPNVGSHVPVPVWQVPAGGQVTALPAMHCPALLQVSFVQALLSKSHEVPLAFAEYVQFPDVGSHVPVPVWQVPAGGQVTALPAMHCPALLQVSFVQALLSKSHEVPFAFAEYVQFPDVGSHVPVPVWQGPAGGQVLALLPLQAPAWHVSVCVHRFPSLQLLPSFTAGFEHVPLLGSHVPAAWHWSLAAQVFGLPPWQAPDWHVSVCVHALPSLHAVPFVLIGFVHVPLVLHSPAAWH